MTKINTAAGALVATVLAISCIYAVNTLVQPASGTIPRVLMIGSADGERWQRTLVGARAAAKEFEVELHAEAPVPNQTVEQQADLVRKIRAADFEGIAVSPEDPASQVDMINDLASRMKLVTVGKDAENSKRLCHIGFCQTNAGRKAASMARQELTCQGHVVLLTTAALAGQDEIVRERLIGFQERWAQNDNSGARYPIVSVSSDAGGDLSQSLADPKLALIIAFDIEAAESAIKATAAWPESKRIPIIALDSSELVLDAIEDGRVSSTIFNDPYQDGYEAIRRLAIYARDDDTALPTPGCGNIPLSGEIVRKSNIADIRGRIPGSVKHDSRTAQLHLSSAESNASLLAH
jgi:ribose transport system substrate-binding protein